MLPPSVALVDAIRIRSPVRTFPDGTTVLDRLTAATTSSGEKPYCRSRSGSTRTTMVRWLPPNGGGADTPGNVAKIGRTRFSAMFCLSPGVRVLRQNANGASGALAVSHRMVDGGPVPLRMIARARFKKIMASAITWLVFHPETDMSQAMAEVM